MTAYFIIEQGAVEIGHADRRAHVLAQLSDLFAENYDLDASTILEGLEEREKLGSTGFGHGVAIPHARIEGLKRPVAALLKLEQPVEFGAADGMPVDIAFGLLSPPQAGAAHLHALAAISRLLRDDAIHEALSEAPDAEALYALLTNAADRDAA